MPHVTQEHSFCSKRCRSQTDHIPQLELQIQHVVASFADMSETIPVHAAGRMFFKKGDHVLQIICKELFRPFIVKISRDIEAIDGGAMLPVYERIGSHARIAGHIGTYHGNAPGQMTLEDHSNSCLGKAAGIRVDTCIFRFVYVFQVTFG